MTTQLTRRGFLARSAGAALAAGLWPGRSFADEAAGENGDFDFIAFNDVHFADPKKCPPWFEKCFAAMRESAPKAEFALLSGDLSTDAREAEFAGMRDLLPLLKLPVHLTPGNHDVTVLKADRSKFDEFFPDRVNYVVAHRGWQIFVLNSVESRSAENTNIPSETLKWLDENLPKHDRRKPTIVSTHYPLGYGLKRRPKNADDLLKRFAPFNVAAIFNGHFHGYTATLFNEALMTTDRCCARSRENHDGSPLKGWFVCEARQGRISRRFVAVPKELA